MGLAVERVVGYTGMSKGAGLEEVKQLLRALQPPISKRTSQTLHSLRTGGGHTSANDDGHISLPSRRVMASSNLLYFRTRNQLLHSSDFKKLSDELPFEVLQARDSQLLTPKGGYYLLFGSFDHAAKYMYNTIGKTLNGVNFYTEMCTPQAHVPYLKSRHLDESFQVVEGDKFTLLNYSSQVPRSHYAVVRGFPTFITRSTLENMLWQYDLSPTDPIRCLSSDKVGKVSSWLIKFNNHLDPQRFVRRYNGKPFDNDANLPLVFASQMD